MMSAVKGKNTTPERAIQHLLEDAGITFETHADDLPARPDIVLRDKMVVILVDGDFWHGWRYSRWRGKISDFWKNKIDRNIRRDERNRRKLRRMGWTVVRVWEHQIEKDPQACVIRIAKAAGLVVDFGGNRTKPR